MYFNQIVNLQTKKKKKKVFINCHMRPDGTTLPYMRQSKLFVYFD